jgi:hypothetical protein
MAGIPFFVLPLPFTVNSAGNQGANQPASNLAEFQFAGMVWATTSTANCYVIIDLGAVQVIDFVGLLQMNAVSSDTYRVTADAVLANVTGGTPSYDSGALAFIAPAVTGFAGYNSHLEITTPISVRYLKFLVTTTTAVLLSRFLIAGKKVQPSRYYEPEWQSAPDDQATISIGRQGVPDIAPGRMLRRSAFTLSWLTEGEMESQVYPLLLAAGRTQPVFCCFDPAATAYRQNRTYFGWMTDTSKPTRKAFNRFEKSFEILSMI